VICPRGNGARGDIGTDSLCFGVAGIESEIGENHVSETRCSYKENLQEFKGG
jgi:hypothetical protein